MPKKEKWKKYLEDTPEELSDSRLSYIGDLYKLELAEENSINLGHYNVFEAKQARYDMIMEYYHRGDSTLKDREVIDMYFEDGLTYKQIAKKLGITSGAIEKRFYRILKKIRGF